MPPFQSMVSHLTLGAECAVAAVEGADHPAARRARLCKPMREGSILLRAGPPSRGRLPRVTREPASQSSIGGKRFARTQGGGADVRGGAGHDPKRTEPPTTSLTGQAMDLIEPLAVSSRYLFNGSTDSLCCKTIPVLPSMFVPRPAESPDICC